LGSLGNKEGTLSGFSKWLDTRAAAMRSYTDGPELNHHKWTSGGGKQ